MDKKTIGIVASVVAGLAAGTGIGIYIYKRKKKKAVIIPIDKVIESADTDGDDTVEEETEETSDDSEDHSGRYDMLARPDLINKPDISSIMKEYDDLEEVEDLDFSVEPEEEDMYDEFVKPDPLQPIRTITEDQFLHESNAFKKELTFYVDPGYLCDDLRVMNNPRTVVGSEVVKSLKDGTISDIVWVRNDILKTDYEITVDPRSYKDVSANYYLPDEESDEDV